MNRFSNIPSIHSDFINSSVEKLKNDNRILGVAAGGSFILQSMDEFSDLDLVVFIDPDYYEEVLKNRKRIAGNIGPLLESFTGEHVGETRLLICLYGPPLLHVDLKFVSLNDMQDRVEDPQILWERDGVVSDNLSETESKFPEPDLDWIENRFWIWIHYTAQKIGRGELFETIDALNFLRGNVLGPMLLQQAGARPQGVRRIEKYASNYLEKLKKTIPSYDPLHCLAALNEAIALYRDLRKKLNQDKNYNLPTRVESEALKYLREIEQMVQTK